MKRRRFYNSDPNGTDEKKLSFFLSFRNRISIIDKYFKKRWKDDFYNTFYNKFWSYFLMEPMKIIFFVTFLFQKKIKKAMFL